MTTSPTRRTRAAALTPGLPVGIYARISKDAKADGRGSRLGVTRQVGECREFAGRHELGDRYEVYEDNDRSGWDPNLVRPDFERLLDDVRAGRLRAVIAWHSDRFTRQPLQLELLWAACKDSGADLYTVLGGHITSALALRVQGAVSAEESDVKSARSKSKHLELARAGMWPGGRRPFGYVYVGPGRLAIRDDEAWIIRRVAERILAGEALYALAKWINEDLCPEHLDDLDACADDCLRGFPTTYGKPFNGPGLGAMIRGKYLVGVREHEGVEYPAAWPEILDRATYELVVHLLNDPTRRPATSNARRYLLSGLATCAECGLPLRSANHRTKPEQVYRCASGRHCARLASQVDRVVEDRVVAYLTLATERGIISADDDDDETRVADLEAAVEEDETTLRELAEELEAGRLTVKAYASATSAISTGQEKRQRELDDLRSQKRRPLEILRDMTGTTAADAWKAASLGRKRAIVDLLYTVELKGAGGRGNRWTPFGPEYVVIARKVDVD